MRLDELLKEEFSLQISLDNRGFAFCDENGDYALGFYPYTRDGISEAIADLDLSLGETTSIYTILDLYEELRAFAADLHNNEQP